jgi:hypothetical protein
MYKNASIERDCTSECKFSSVINMSRHGLVVSTIINIFFNIITKKFELIDKD